VEDDPGVRGLARKIFARLGYHVLVAASGAEALTIAAGHQAPIDLLFTDVVMPALSGRDVAGKLVETHPETRVLYTSGYTDDLVLRLGVVERELPFIAKPYTAADLARKLRDVLARKG
jgi:CheY-like chemotaxis protein